MSQDGLVAHLSPSNLFIWSQNVCIISRYYLHPVYRQFRILMRSLVYKSGMRIQSHFNHGSHRNPSSSWVDMNLCLERTIARPLKAPVGPPSASLNQVHVFLRSPCIMISVLISSFWRTLKCMNPSNSKSELLSWKSCGQSGCPFLSSSRENLDNL